ncbi:MAG: hypothetical protein COA88_12920 [Kordia sp.]|nr:MAG: hypothetical protein COA88_12920 [Kordia sp.]
MRKIKFDDCVKSERVKISDIIESGSPELKEGFKNVLSTFLNAEKYADEIKKDEFLVFQEMTNEDWERLQKIIK